jgi:serine/threonine protein phosphatase PrpC
MSKPSSNALFLILAIAASISIMYWLFTRIRKDYTSSLTPSGSIPTRTVRVQHTSIQNRRESMEDAFFHRTCGDKWLGAVMDGHGGPQAALICKQIIQRRSDELHSCSSPEKWARDVFQECERTCIIQCTSGTTIALCIASLSTGECMCIWVGDSGALFCTKNDFSPLYKPHKPDEPHEKARILRDGGFVSQSRTNGILAMSRAIGDRALKPAVSPLPDVIFAQALPLEHFHIALFSDGLSDALDDLTIAKACSEGYSPSQMASVAIRDGSLDNITIIIASFSPLPS